MEKPIVPSKEKLTILNILNIKTKKLFSFHKKNPQDFITIGTNKNCDYIINHDNSSEEKVIYGTIEKTSNYHIWVYIDLSIKGTWINDTKFLHHDAMIIHNNDILKINNDILQIHLKAENVSKVPEDWRKLKFKEIKDNIMNREKMENRKLNDGNILPEYSISPSVKKSNSKAIDINNNKLNDDSIYFPPLEYSRSPANMGMLNENNIEKNHLNHEKKNINVNGTNESLRIKVSKKMAKYNLFSIQSIKKDDPINDEKTNCNKETNKKFVKTIFRSHSTFATSPHTSSISSKKLNKNYLVTDSLQNKYENVLEESNKHLKCNNEEEDLRRRLVVFSSNEFPKSFHLESKNCDTIYNEEIPMDIETFNKNLKPSMSTSSSVSSSAATEITNFRCYLTNNNFTDNSGQEVHDKLTNENEKIRSSMSSSNSFPSCYSSCSSSPEHLLKNEIMNHTNNYSSMEPPTPLKISQKSSKKYIQDKYRLDLSDNEMQPWKIPNKTSQNRYTINGSRLFLKSLESRKDEKYRHNRQKLMEFSDRNYISGSPAS